MERLAEYRGTVTKANHKDGVVTLTIQLPEEAIERVTAAFADPGYELNASFQITETEVILQAEETLTFEDGREPVTLAEQRGYAVTNVHASIEPR